MFIYYRVGISVGLRKFVFPTWSCNPKTYDSFKDIDSIWFTQKVHVWVYRRRVHWRVFKIHVCVLSNGVIQVPHSKGDITPCVLGEGTPTLFMDVPNHWVPSQKVIRVPLCGNGSMEERSCMIGSDWALALGSLSFPFCHAIPIPIIHSKI